MTNSKQGVRIGIAVVVILATISYLAISGVQANKSYYVTIQELQAMGDPAYKRHLRVEGFVQPHSIQTNGTHVSFVLTEFESHSTKKTAAERIQRVDYKGTEPPPDTFKDDAQALAIGTYGHDGVFHATQLQAKCASKYTPAPGATPGSPGAAPAAKPTGTAAVVPPDTGMKY
jgi:cytochrome c-type biogenesis protein CcmE